MSSALFIDSYMKSAISSLETDNFAGIGEKLFNLPKKNLIRLEKEIMTYISLMPKWIRKSIKSS